MANKDHHTEDTSQKLPSTCTQYWRWRELEWLDRSVIASDPSTMSIFLACMWKQTLSVN